MNSIERKKIFRMKTAYGRILGIALASVLVLLVAASVVKAQGAPEVEWERTFGGGGYDYGTSVQQTNDGGYIVTGHYDKGYGWSDIYLIKTDPFGNTEWEKLYDRTYADHASAVRQTTDGGYIIAGAIASPRSDDYFDAYLLKTDTSGNIDWEVSFNAGRWDWAYSIQQTNDGGYIAAGSGFHLMKTNALGEIEWLKSFSNYGSASSIQQTTDGGYVIAGSTSTWNMYLIKANASGDEEWEKTLTKTNSSLASSVQQTTDGGYIVAGYTYLGYGLGCGNDDFHIIKTDAFGNIEWERTFGKNCSDRASSIQQTTDGGYIVVGDGVVGDVGKVYLIKTDASGNKEWEKYVGGSGWDGAYSGQQTTDGGYIVVGMTESYGTPRADVYLIKLKGLNQLPIANAGPDQTVHVGSIVTLDGSGSSDPDGNFPLTYEWSFISVPSGSTASLSDPKIVNPTFTPDLPGDYVLQLVVSDSLGATSATDTVTISTLNSVPVADAGADQSITLLGTIVQLHGTQSYDPDGDTITYQWTFASLPAGSTAPLNGANTAIPTFVADVHGDYLVQLVVSDPWTQSLPDTVTVSFENIKPVANAGTSQSVEVGETVTLDGSASSDANNDPLTYRWAFSSVPEGSLSVIADPTAIITTFVPDLPGTYVVQLIVNDVFVDSDPSTIQVQAVSLKTKAIEAVQTLQTQIASLNPDVFKNANMQNALLNKLNAVIANIEAGNYEDALGQLQNDILGKTDGCANSGSPDKNDWIKDYGSQGIIYPYVLNAIAKVKELL